MLTQDELNSEVSEMSGMSRSQVTTPTSSNVTFRVSSQPPDITPFNKTLADVANRNPAIISRESDLEVPYAVDPTPHPSTNMNFRPIKGKRIPQNKWLLLWNGSLYFIVGMALLAMSIERQTTLHRHYTTDKCCECYHQSIAHPTIKFEYSICQSKVRKYGSETQNLCLFTTTAAPIPRRQLLGKLSYTSEFLGKSGIKKYYEYGIWAAVAGFVYASILACFHRRLMAISIFLLNAIITLLQYYCTIKILQYSRSDDYNGCYIRGNGAIEEWMLRVCLYAPLTYLGLYFMLNVWWRINNSRCGGNQTCRKSYAYAYGIVLYLGTFGCVLLGLMLLVLVILVSIQSNFGRYWQWVALSAGLLLLLNTLCNQFVWRLGKTICGQIGVSELDEEDTQVDAAPMIHSHPITPHNQPLVAGSAQS